LLHNGAVAENVSGNLACLHFDVAANSTESQIGLTAPEDDISSWSVSAFTPGCTGDVNKDGRITPQDALCAFEKYMGMRILMYACG
jgi:hypothetical protein